MSCLSNIDYKKLYEEQLTKSDQLEKTLQALTATLEAMKQTIEKQAQTIAELNEKIK